MFEPLLGLLTRDDAALGPSYEGISAGILGPRSRLKRDGTKFEPLRQAEPEAVTSRSNESTALFLRPAIFLEVKAA
jgi:hypothetical protein